MIVGEAEILAYVNTEGATADLDAFAAEQNEKFAAEMDAAGAEAGAGLSTGIRAGAQDLEGDLGAVAADSGAVLSAGLHDGAQDAAADLGGIREAARGAEGGLSDLEDAAGAAGIGLGGMSEHADAVAGHLDDAATHAEDLHTGLSDVSGVAGDAGMALGGLAGAAKDSDNHLSSLRRTVEDAGKDAEKSGGLFKDLLGNIGVPEALLGGWGKLGIAVAATAAGALDLGAKYQAAETQIAAAAHISVTAADLIGKAFLGTAGHSIYSAKDMADAFSAVAGQLESTEGHALNASEALKVMQAASNLAEGSSTDLSSATAALSSTMQGFQISAGGAAHVADVLYQASDATGLGVTQLATGLARMHTQAGAVAPPLGDLSALLVDLAHHGETGRGAFTILSQAMTGLLKPSADLISAQRSLKISTADLPPSLEKLAGEYTAGKLTGEGLTKATEGMSATQANAFDAFVKSSEAVDAARQAQQKLGISVVDSHGKFLGMTTVIDELHQKIAGMSGAEATAELQALGLGSSASKLVPIIEAGGSAFAKTAGEVNKSGAAQEAAAKQSHTLGHEFDTARSAVEDWLTKLSGGLTPALTELGAVIEGDVAPAIGHGLKDAFDAAIHVGHAFGDVIEWFKKGSAPALALASAVGAVLAPTFVKLGIDAVTSLSGMAAEAAKSFASMIVDGAGWVAENAAQAAGIIARNLGLNVSWGETAIAAREANAVASEAMEETAGVSAEAAAAIERANMLVQMSEESLAEGWMAGSAKMEEASASVSAAIEGTAGVTDAAAVEMDAAIGSTGVGAILIGLGLAATVLATHWHEVWDGIKDAALAAWHFLDDDVLHPIEHAFDDVVKWIKAHWELLAEILLAPFSPVLAIFIRFHDEIIHGFEDIFHFGVDAWRDLWHGVEEVFEDIAKGWLRLQIDTLHFFEDAGHWLFDAGKEIVMGLVHGIEDMVGDAVHAVEHVGHDILHAITSFFGIFSPSRVMMEVGGNIVAGLSEGISKNSGQATDAMSNLNRSVLKSASATDQFTEAGKRLGKALTEGITAEKNFGVNSDTLRGHVSDLNQIMTTLGQTVTNQGGAFQNLSTTSHESVQQMMNGLNASNTQLTGWANDAQLLLKEGANPQFIDQLAENAPQELSTMARATTSQIKQMNVEWEEQWLLMKGSAEKGIGGYIGAIKDGLDSGIPALRAAAERLMNSLHIHFNSVEWGLSVTQGLTQGISEGTGAAAAQAQKTAAEVEQAASNHLRRHSPSQLFREIGRDVSLGLALGIRDAAGEASAASERLAEDVERAFGARAGGEFATGGPAAAGSARPVNVYVQPGAVVNNIGPGTGADVVSVLERTVADGFDKLAEELNAGVSAMAVKSS